MKILLSAYACLPNKGSEPGVGWNWATALSKFYEVHVITREANKELIEQQLNKTKTDNIVFHYCDNKVLSNLLCKSSIGEYIYYILWQFYCFKTAKEVHKVEKFSIAQHLTYATFRTVSLLYRLKIPFVLGPVGGGEQAPKSFYLKFSFKQFMKEILRDLHSFLSRFNPYTYNAWKYSSLILLTTDQTKAKIPKKFRDKCEVYQTIGIESNIISEKYFHKEKTKNEPFKILYIGNILELKGIDLLIDSFNKYHHEVNKDSQLIILGDGNYKHKMLIKIKQYDLLDKVKIIPEMQRDTVFDYYKDCDVFLFPSLHDSGAMVVLEAMANCIPIICLDLGGPGNNLKKGCGIKIEAKNYNQTVEDLVKALKFICDNKDKSREFAKNALRHVSEEFLYDKKALKMKEFYKKVLNEELSNEYRNS